MHMNWRSPLNLRLPSLPIYNTVTYHVTIESPDHVKVSVSDVQHVIEHLNTYRAIQWLFIHHRLLSLRSLYQTQEESTSEAIIKNYREFSSLGFMWLLSVLGKTWIPLSLSRQSKGVPFTAVQPHNIHSLYHSSPYLLGHTKRAHSQRHICATKKSPYATLFIHPKDNIPKSTRVSLSVSLADPIGTPH